MVGNGTTSEVLYLCSQIERELGDNRASTDCINDLLRDFPESREALYVISNRQDG